jgi:hypothetical protein
VLAACKGESPTAATPPRPRPIVRS